MGVTFVTFHAGTTSTAHKTQSPGCSSRLNRAHGGDDVPGYPLFALIRGLREFSSVIARVGITIFSSESHKSPSPCPTVCIYSSRTRNIERGHLTCGPQCVLSKTEADLYVQLHVHTQCVLHMTCTVIQYRVHTNQQVLISGHRQ